jgi:uncharacterized repeat protein (TIGR04076 family)
MGGEILSKVKITVIKKMGLEEVYGDALPNVSDTFQSPCTQPFKEGDVFISESGENPEGFCAWAFADLQRDIIHLRFGGDYPWMAEKGVTYQCCTDGLRPVFFKLERIED